MPFFKNLVWLLGEMLMDDTLRVKVLCFAEHICAREPPLAISNGLSTGESPGGTVGCRRQSPAGTPDQLPHPRHRHHPATGVPQQIQG